MLPTPINEIGRYIASGKRIVDQTRDQEITIVANPSDFECFEGHDQAVARLFARIAVGDDLGHHRIIEWRDRITLAVTGVDAYAVGLRRAEALKQARRRHELLGRIFGIEPGLDGMPLSAYGMLRHRRQTVAREIDLHLDQIEPCDHLDDRMLDLDAGVHFQKVEREAVRIDHEFDGAGAAVACCLAERHRGRGHAITHLLWQVGRRAFLDHFSEAPLQ